MSAPSNQRAFTTFSSHERGFTLVELLVVISIIAILSVIGITVFSSAQKSARDARRRGDLIALKNAIVQYSLANHSLPPEGGCSGNWSAAFVSALEPAYITKVPVDPLKGQTSCSGSPCIYCYSSDMWCSDNSTTYPCTVGIANVWAYLESCSSSNATGDAPRFKYGCPHFMKSIDPF